MLNSSARLFAFQLHNIRVTRFDGKDGWEDDMVFRENKNFLSK